MHTSFHTDQETSPLLAIELDYSKKIETPHTLLRPSLENPDDIVHFICLVNSSYLEFTLGLPYFTVILQQIFLSCLDFTELQLVF